MTFLQFFFLLVALLSFRLSYTQYFLFRIHTLLVVNRILFNRQIYARIFGARVYCVWEARLGLKYLSVFMSFHFSYLFGTTMRISSCIAQLHVSEIRMMDDNDVYFFSLREILSTVK